MSMTSVERPKRKLRFRGAGDNVAQFASRYIEARLQGFQKDMEICLSGRPSTTRSGLTHAYFPALMGCCSMLEYLAWFYTGPVKTCGTREIVAYARFLPQPDYNEDSIRVLFDAFRHAVAHRGIASGLWVDQHAATRGRRLTWKISELEDSPALEVRREAGTIRLDSPWECPFTHRVTIRLGRLWRDIKTSALSAGGYRDELLRTPKLQKNFEGCMKRLYPA